MIKRDIIAIQTPHYALNYGAELQAFALGEAIKTLGYDIEYIDRRPSYFHEYKCFIDKWFKKKEYTNRAKGFSEFEKNHIGPLSIRIIHNEQYDRLNTDRYRAIVVGSDQIWRDDYFHHSFDYAPYLYFVQDKNIKKVAYAASFGKKTCIHPEERRRKIEQYLKDFSAISVREASGISILRNIYHTDGVCVADPTLLLDKDYYLKSLNLRVDESLTSTLTTYLLGQSRALFTKVEAIGKEIGCPCNHIYKKRCSDLFYKRYFELFYRFEHLPSVYTWLTYIASSKYILTDSFHGMVFSILFGKQFVVFDKVSGGSERYISLLEKLGLLERLCKWNSLNEDVVRLLKTPIDYDNVYHNIQQFREESYAFLAQALK